MTTHEALIDRYCEAWSTQDPTLRKRLIHETLTEDGTYTDPQVNPLTPSALVAHIEHVHASMPGVVVRRTSMTDGHHGYLRFGWQATLPGGPALPESVDFIELSADGTRIRTIVGFFGALRPLPGSGSSQPPAAT